ncbi:DNA polymerase III subunit gamma and tau [Actinomycetospora cinnamomea]|uniref:DNA polymerase III subunit gamma/tau n=1 Tax=Actinomycetospora cinnamomea TaxID=663609 RepID=A0A2U1FB67_9PSEU|nr:DNA polymerase III subunit gamma and tau [Actinomycetospora cinnamomea]PVZ09433.1 DNA polymerase III tau subunit [Actinomycetospora cinnamomea]
MALALYRRYRPATFAEVVGQEHVTEPLRTALAAGRVNHAYLFSGPRGCGKTSSARILARSLNCVQGPTPDPCGVCESCVALAPNGAGSLDVTEMDAASHNGVDDARELRDRAHFAPVSSRYRVFIIDEAHMVTTAAFNALLKVVEEPPDHLIFIFATTEPDKVLTTIRSRTHHYPFRLLPPSTLRGLLERICTEEGVTVEPAVYPLVVRAGGGSARDSLSVLDQLLAGAGPEGVTYAHAVGLLGVTDVAILDDVVDALGAQDGAAVFGAVDRLVEAGHDPRRFAADLLQRLRDLVLVQAVPDAGERGLVDVPADEMERMLDQAARLGPAALTRYAELVHTALTEMRGATAPRLLLELVCARMLLPSASSEDAAMVQRLEGVERRLALGAGGGGGTPADDGGERFTRPSRRPTEGDADPAPARAGELDATVVPPTDRPTATVAARDEPPRDAPPREAARAEPASRPQPAPGPVSQPEPAQQPTREPAPAGAVDAAALRRVWPEVMNQVRERNKPTHALLQNATVTAVEGTTVTLGMPTPPLARQLSQPNRADHVAAALGIVLSGQWTVQAVHGAGGDGDGPARGGGRSEAPRTRAEAPRRPERSERPERPAPSRPERPAPQPPARGGGEAPPRPTRSGEPPDIPPPPEPPEDDPDEHVTEEDMYAEAAADPGGTGGGVRRDPEEAAMELLTSQLGARRVDGR